MEAVSAFTITTAHQKLTLVHIAVVLISVVLAPLESSLAFMIAQGIALTT